MGKVAIVTDSNSGITQDLARDLGVSVIPMPFYINEKLYLEGIDRKSTRLNSSHITRSRMPSSA